MINALPTKLSRRERVQRRHALADVKDTFGITAWGESREALRRAHTVLENLGYKPGKGQ